jgi:hypothetical protein
MNRYDPDRPSIFSKPDDEDAATAEPRAPHEPPYGENPTIVTSASSPPHPPRPRRPAHTPEPPQSAGVPPNVRIIVLASMGIAILALGGFIAASILRPADDPGVALASEEPSSSVASPTPSPSPSEAPSATAEPTPEPTPAGPPQEVALAGWATVTVGELNVRRSPGEGEASVYRLVEGAVVHVSEGPTAIDGANWYRVASLGGAVGWASSGWIAEPHLETLVADPTLIRCGKVMQPVFEIVDGAPRPDDPLRIGTMAVPVAAFSDISLGVIELLRGMDQEACFAAEIGSAGTPVVRTDLNVSACGHSEFAGAFYRLRPAADERVSLSSQVKEPVVVHSSIMAGGPEDDPMSRNIARVVSMMANEGVSGCIQAGAAGTVNDVRGYRSVNVSQCSIVHEYIPHRVNLSPAAGGDATSIRLTADGYQAGQFPLESPVWVSVYAEASNDGRYASAWNGGTEGCG